MKVREQVGDIIRNRWKGLKDPEELISQHSVEKQTNQGYNGRQLLELFQNCEDEGANSVTIHLNTSDNILEISNDGQRPFSVNGYKSLFYPGLSSKVSSNFIGNKGLGFRSIINWSQSVSIISNDFKLIFDKSLQKDTLLDKIGYSVIELDRIRKERKLKQEVFPVPFLNCCKILDLEGKHDFTTTISINYLKEFEPDIINQINSINEKTLLFLNHINKIKIIGNKIQRDISVSRISLGNNMTRVHSNGKVIYVLSDEGIVDEELTKDQESTEPKRYSVKIAYNDFLTFKDNVLYNYFKTKMPFDFPFVAHASLELDQNRNHSTESKVNPFILKKLLQLHLKLIKQLKGNDTKSWLPYSAIDKESEHIYLPYLGLIESVWESLEIYPTIAGKYENYLNAKNLGSSIARFLEDNKLQAAYSNQILEVKNITAPLKYIRRPGNFVEVLETIGEKLDIEQRAYFIKLVLQEFPNERLSILIDENGKLIKTSDYVYTNKTSDNKALKVPSYSTIRFIHGELYDRLIFHLSLQNELNKARALKDKLDKMSDVHSFEPMIVMRKLISETHNLIKEDRNDKADLLREFYQTLFYNYQLRDDNYTLEYNGLVPCVNSVGEIVDIRDLVLSDQFEVANKAFEQFGKFYGEQNELVGLEYLGLEDEDRSEVQRFLLWLGINQCLILNRGSDKITPAFANYTKKKFAYTPTSGELYWIQDFEEILKNMDLSVSDVIALLHHDQKIQEVFSNFSQRFSRKESLKYTYYGARSFDKFETLIYYQVKSHFGIDDYLITNKREEWFNPFRMDYEFLYEFDQNLNKNEVNRILSFFGAKIDFNDLRINYLKKKTNELAERNNPTGSQVFYKSLVAHYKKNQKELSGCQLYARVSYKIVVEKAEKIYFSDRIQLPDSLTSKFPLFYFPSRSGGSAAIEMFGLKDLNLLDLSIVNAKVNYNIQDEFERYLKEVKPFVLAFRLDKITQENVKKGQVQLLNKLQIVCCEHIICKIEGEEFEVEEFNYVFDKKKDVFYIYVPDGNNLSDLQDNKLFIDNLSDIFLKLFDTHDEKKTFEAILRQSYEDNLYDVNNELAEGLLEESKVLLGELSVRLSIWRGIFNLKGLDFEILNEHNLDEELKKRISELGSFDSFYSDQKNEELSSIREVFRKLQIDLSEYNAHSEYKLSFDPLFQTELEDFYNLKKKSLKNQLWQSYSGASFDVQSSFLNGIHKIENLLRNYHLTEKLSDYDFEKVILSLLSQKLEGLSFTLGEQQFIDYDLLEKKNSKKFNSDELVKLGYDERLRSLNYFEGHFEYIKSQVEELLREESTDIEEPTEVKYSIRNREPKKVSNFEIELPEKRTESPNKPWLGNKTTELSSHEKKKLGNDAETTVIEYLEMHPEQYSNIEHISKTDEGAHYDIKYFDIKNQSIKYVECKYYNGVSFTITREEKKFALSNISQYEIWLVNKYDQIFCIDNFKDLGELEPTNYKVHIKIKEYEVSN